jgi:DNA replication protein DnaC
MNKQIFNKIKMEYEKRQRNNLYNYFNSKNALYNKIPEIEKIDLEIKQSGINLNRLIIMGKAEQKRVLLNRIEKLKEQKFNLLRINNYPLESLKKRYTCNICKDTGFVSIGNKTKKCSCFEQLIITYLYEESNLNMTELENFETFNESLYSDIPLSLPNDSGIIKCSPKENMHSIKRNVERFINNFEVINERPNGVLFQIPYQVHNKKLKK